MLDGYMELELRVQGFGFGLWALGFGGGGEGRRGGFLADLGTRISGFWFGI